MAEPRMYKGRPIKPNVQIKKEIIDGEEREILVMPTGMKNPYADGDEKKTATKKTTKPNPQKETMLDSLIETLLQFSADGKVYKTKESKYAVKTAEGKWFSMALTANKAEPKEKTEHNTDKEEEGE